MREIFSNTKQITLFCLSRGIRRRVDRQPRASSPSLHARHDASRAPIGAAIVLRPAVPPPNGITFSGEGDEYAVSPRGAPPCAQDIVFIIREAKHERFHREGSDLHYRIKISLSDALCGFTHDIKMLDEQERVKRLNMRTPVSNVMTKVLAGEGMPKSKEPGKKGDLIITFEVAFPTRELTDTQKAAVRSALPMG